MSSPAQPLALDRPVPESASMPAFLAACRSLPAAHTPVWLMRQAGRYLPEYRALRARHGFLTLMRTPELAAEVTLQPLRRFPLDAAILFADILTPLDGLGLGLDFAPGPVLERPLRSPSAIEALAIEGVAGRAAFVAETIAIVRRQLPAATPLIGFAGAPFTLFCYLVEGRGGSGFETALAFLEREPAASAKLLDKLADLAIDYLQMQALAGAQALMLFDSWAGLLAPERFRELALPGVRRIFERLAPLGLPRVYFPRSRFHSGLGLLPAVADLPLEVVGVDAQSSLARARALLPPGVAVQGNLDPAALGEDDAGLDRRIDLVLEEAGPGPGHIFNLGDGVPRTADPARVLRLIEHVHRRTRRVESR